MNNYNLKHIYMIIHDETNGILSRIRYLTPEVYNDEKQLILELAENLNNEIYKKRSVTVQSLPLMFELISALYETKDPELEEFANELVNTIIKKNR